MGHKFMNWAKGDNIDSKIFIKTDAYFDHELRTQTSCFNNGEYALEIWASHILTHYNEKIIDPYWRWIQEYFPVLNGDARGFIENMWENLPNRYFPVTRQIQIWHFTADINSRWLDSCIQYSNLNTIPNNLISFGEMMLKPIEDMIMVLNKFITQDTLSIKEYRLSDSDMDEKKRHRFLKIVKFKPLNNGRRIILGEYFWWCDDGHEDLEGGDGSIKLQMEMPIMEIV